MCKNFLLILVALILGLAIFKWHLNNQNKNLAETKIIKQNHDLSLIIKEFAQKYNALDDWQVADFFYTNSIDLYYKMGGKSDRNIITIANLDDLLIKNHGYYIKLSSESNDISYIFLLECNYEQFETIKDKASGNILPKFAVIVKTKGVNRSEGLAIYYVEGLYVDSMQLPQTYRGLKEDRND